MVSVHRMPLVAGLVLALACTVVNAKVYTFTEKEGTTIFAPYSKLEDAKPGESVAAYNQLFQGVVVGEIAGPTATAILLCALYPTYRLQFSIFVHLYQQINEPHW